MIKDFERLNEQTQSLLFSLPTEIRNDIYERALAVQHGEINLLEAPPPSKALIATCRRVHAEAKGIYRGVYRAFWSESDFVVPLLPPPTDEASDAALRKILDKFRSIDISHIRNLRIEGQKFKCTYRVVNSWTIQNGSVFEQFAFWFDARYRDALLLAVSRRVPGPEWHHRRFIDHQEILFPRGPMQEAVGKSELMREELKAVMDLVRGKRRVPDPRDGRSSVVAGWIDLIE